MLLKTQNRGDTKDPIPLKFGPKSVDFGWIWANNVVWTTSAMIRRRGEDKKRDKGRWCVEVFPPVALLDAW